MSCDTEKLEQLLDGSLAADELRETEAHLVACNDCRDEIAWLRAERRLMTERAKRHELPPAIWAGIEARLAKPVRPVIATPADEPRKSWFWGMLGGGVTLVATAAMALVLFGLPRQVSLDEPLQGMSTVTTPTPDKIQSNEDTAALRTILDAEWQYLDAIEELERDHDERRRRLPPATVAELDRQFAELRQDIVQARKAAGNDPEGRQRALGAYAAYVRTMQRVAFDEELREVAP